MSKGKENNQTEYESLSKAFDSVRLKLENATKKHSGLLKLQAELSQWKNFEIVFKGDVETILATEIKLGQLTDLILL